MQGPERGLFHFVGMNMRLPRFADTPSTGIGWSLLPAAAAVPWLLMPMGQPWVSFHAQALTALVWLATALALAARDRRGPAVPWLAWLFAALALTPWLQVAAGRLEEPTQAVMPTLHLLAVALAVVLGATADARRLLDALFAACLLAAVVSTGLALAQWLRIDTDILVPTLVPGQRPMANLGQPNNLATLILWGLAALWWAWSRRRVGSAVATLAAVWLTFGLLLTQSRSGALGLVLLAALAAVRAGDAGRPVDRRWLVVVLATFVLGSVLWPWLTELAGLQAARSLAEGASAGKRPAIWGLMIDAVWVHPWLGHGWGQTAQAHLALIDTRPPIHSLITYAHNLPLDLAVWAGLPVALLVTIALAWWLLDRWRHAVDDVSWIALAALGVFLLHALVELPHAYLTFLLPAALLAGVVEQTVQAPRRRASLRLPWSLSLGLSLLLTVQIVVEYQGVQSDLLAYRLRTARIGDLTPPAPPRVWLLTDLQRTLEGVRILPREGMSPDELASMLRGVRRSPRDVALFSAAQALALNGQPAQAARQLARLCRLYPASSCTRANQAWRAWQAEAFSSPASTD